MSVGCIFTIHACRVSPCSRRTKPICSSIMSCLFTAAKRSSICVVAISTFVAVEAVFRVGPRCITPEPRRRNVPRPRMAPAPDDRADGMSGRCVSRSTRTKQWEKGLPKRRVACHKSFGKQCKCVDYHFVGCAQHKRWAGNEIIVVVQVSCDMPTHRSTKQALTSKDAASHIRKYIRERCFQQIQADRQQKRENSISKLRNSIWFQEEPMDIDISYEVCMYSLISGFRTHFT